jgi:hypothetical protein
LQHGADINAVGNDIAVVAMMRYRLRNESDQEAIEKRIHGRGEEYYYDTPLRIVENRMVREVGSPFSDGLVISENCYSNMGQSLSTCHPKSMRVPT